MFTDGEFKLYQATRTFQMGRESGRGGVSILQGERVLTDGNTVRRLSDGSSFENSSAAAAVEAGFLSLVGSEEDAAIPPVRTLSTSGSLLPSDHVVSVDTSSGAVTVTLPPLADCVGGHTFTLAVRGSNNCSLNSHASDGSAMELAVVGITLKSGARLRVAKLVQGGTQYWGIISRANGLTAAGDYIPYPNIVMKDDGRIAVGNLSTAGSGFTEPAAPIHIPGVNTGTGIRLGDNGLSGDNNDYILRARNTSFGAGTLELLYVNINSGRGRLALLGNAASRMDLFCMDGSIVVGAEADAHPYTPTDRIEVRSAAALQFGVSSTGQIKTNQTEDPSTGTPGSNANKAMRVYDQTGTLLGYIPVYATKW